ncbi:amylovoran biosynthesis protein AmsE [Escherichia coli]|nr:amylovoran biosynthesis protein AmsE [Escherichia coli]
MMKFSVLMSLYDKEQPEFLNDCLTSLARQSVMPTEIVIVYDGYVNNALKKVVNSYLSILPIKILQLPNNIGLGLALNQGLKYCAYDYVARMDTDDICVDNRFERQVAHIIQHPELSICGGGISEYDLTLTHFWGNRDVPKCHSEIKKYITMRNPFNHMTVMFKKNDVLSVGGYVHHDLMEDYNLWIRMLSKGFKASNLDGILVHARTGNAMLCRRKGWRYIKSEFYLAKVKIEYNIQSVPYAYFIMVARVVPRLLPTKFLSLFYRITRKTKL